MKKSLALVALASLALTGCVSYPEIQDEPSKQGQQSEQGKSATYEDRNRTRSLHPVEVYLEDGTTVECIVYKDANAGGLSCNWDAAQ